MIFEIIIITLLILFLINSLIDFNLQLRQLLKDKVLLLVVINIFIILIVFGTYVILNKKTNDLNKDGKIDYLDVVYFNNEVLNDNR